MVAGKHQLVKRSVYNQNVVGPRGSIPELAARHHMHRKCRL